jgi:hypothetical protein
MNSNPRCCLLSCMIGKPYSLKSLGGSSTGTTIGTGLMARLMALYSFSVGYSHGRVTFRWKQFCSPVLLY